jgi:type II secretory pathway pseudopilin PulG
LQPGSQTQQQQQQQEQEQQQQEDHQQQQQQVQQAAAGNNSAGPSNAPPPTAAAGTEAEAQAGSSEASVVEVGLGSSAVDRGPSSSLECPVCLSTVPAGTDIHVFRWGSSSGWTLVCVCGWAKEVSRPQNLGPSFSQCGVSPCISYVTRLPGL